tara:strand:- start:4465 stop:5628 length:1164 start_codon:yes stop_codon:yes gene_type:complete
MSEEVKPVVGYNEDGDVKLDFSQDAVQEQSTDEVSVRDESETSGEVQEQNIEETVEESTGESNSTEDVVEEQEVEEAPVLREITEEEVEEVAEELHEEVEEAIAEAAEAGKQLPENIQKVVDFMNETGGSLEDYVRLNTDYSSLNENALLREYYQAANPDLDAEDINFLMDDKFSYDEDIDDEKEIRRKKVERKQELSKAKSHLEGLKNKYYDEIKANTRLNPEQQKAIDFFDRYNKESQESAKVAKRQSERFQQESAKVFSDKFEGFDFNVGEKKYRFNVKNAKEVSETQGDINNFIGKFLDKNGEMSDAKGYHKSLFTAMNPDQIAQHFYEQGRTDALKDSVAKAKNVDMGPRGVHEKVKASNGVTYRVLNPSEGGSRLKIKTRK